MALAAGDFVIAAASVMNPTPGGVLHTQPPKFGVCESLAPAVIDWEDGTQTSYAALGTGATAVILGVAQIVPASDLLSAMVAPAPSAFPNPGGRFTGSVVAHFSVVDPTSGVSVEVAIVKTPEGFYAAGPAALVVIPNA